MKQVERSHLTVVALTDEGARGKKNEDRFGVSAYQRRDRRKTPVLLAVLADGIGGHRAGEVAADLAVDQISSYLAASAEGLSPAEALQGAVETASQAIYQHAAAAPDRLGMGATCAIAYVIGMRLFAANVGDSRIYLLRDRKLRQLSVDHTWIQEALDHGVLSEDQVKGHPNAHVIRRFLGSPQPPEAAICQRLEGQPANGEAGVLLQKDDILLLCSDGLTDLVSDEEIGAMLSSQPLENAGAGLIDLANQRGGHDNITLILLQVPEKLAKKNGRWRGFWLAGCLSMIILVVLAAAIIFGTNWLSPEKRSTPTPTLEGIIPPITVVTQLPTIAAATAAPPVAPGSLVPQISPTRPAYPAPSSGATLTPWPTNTPMGGLSYP
jgi:protein phosphatase